MSTSSKKRGRRVGATVECRSEGYGIIWPAGVEARYDISKTTRWLWEQSGKLPPRDVHPPGFNRPIGWKPATLDAWDRGERPSVRNAKPAAA